MNGKTFVTMRDLVNLNEIARAAQTTAKVIRVMPDDNTPVKGIARCIGDQNGNFVTRDGNVADEYLRVTLESGFEAFWPVRELVDEVYLGRFARYEW